MNQIILPIFEFNEIVKGIKAMKADLVCVYSDNLFGVNQSISSVKIFKLPFTINSEPFIIVSNTLNKEFFANITDTSIILDFNINKIYCLNNTKYAKKASDNMVFKEIDNYILNKVLGLIQERMYGEVIDFGDITNQEQFQIIKSLKSADGAVLYYPNGNEEYKMFLFSGALPMNKSDIVTLKIYDTRNKLFIAEFTIFKKKIGYINVYFKVLKI